MPYWVAVKNWFVVTWLTNTIFQDGMCGGEARGPRGSRSGRRRRASVEPIAAVRSSGSSAESAARNFSLAVEIVPDQT